MLRKNNDAARIEAVAQDGTMYRFYHSCTLLHDGRRVLVPSGRGVPVQPEQRVLLHVQQPRVSA
jgi:hypothetical protein